MVDRPMKRRVIDKTNSDTGTAVRELGRGKYRVQWDNPTPFQDMAKVPIPSEHFDWAGPEQCQSASSP